MRKILLVLFVSVCLLGCNHNKYDGKKTVVDNITIKGVEHLIGQEAVLKVNGNELLKFDIDRQEITKVVMYEVGGK